MDDFDQHAIRKQEWRKGEKLRADAFRAHEAGETELAEHLEAAAGRHALETDCTTYRRSR